MDKPDLSPAFQDFLNNDLLKAKLSNDNDVQSTQQPFFNCQIEKTSFNFVNSVKREIPVIHTKLNDETKYMFNKQTLSTMKPTSVIINCARGGLINEADLKDALNNGVIAGAAIDVYENEPATDNVMFGTKNLLLTPHLGASSKEAQSNVAIDVANQVADFLKEDKIINNVNSF